MAVSLSTVSVPCIEVIRRSAMVSLWLLLLLLLDQHLRLTPGRQARPKAGARRTLDRQRPRSRAAKQSDELAAFQLVKWHSVAHQPGPNTKVSNWGGSVSRYGGFFNS